MRAVLGATLLALLAACAGPGLVPVRPEPPAPAGAASSRAPASAVSSAASNAAPMSPGGARWVSARWEDLPGWPQDPLFEAWNAWIKSCERPAAPFASLCPQVRTLSIASEAEQRAWIEQHLQPYRIESAQGSAQGLLTAYFEPVLEAARQPQSGYAVPLYALPAGWGARKPWYSRQEIDTLPQAQEALRGRVLAYLADPVDALVLQIQGSGRLRLREADGSVRSVRLAYAGSNEQPYRSVGRWLLDQGLVKDASWPGIRAWLAQNPQRQQELLWANPRVVFFKEEPLSDLDSAFGPRGAQGVALTPGRSIAVDPQSIPYGAPVWIASEGPTAQLQRLVLAQDTGSAITGAVRADYFAGWGEGAAALAGRMRQGLQMWILWPK
ncbi:MAG: murein transglycosylase A [Rhodoferax sp.]